MRVDLRVKPMSPAMKVPKVSFNRFSSERGAIGIRDIFTSIVVFLIFGAIAGPFALQQQTQVQSASAVADARALAIEVERFLASNPGINVTSPVPIAYDGGVGILTIPLVGLEGEKATTRLTLSPNAAIPAAQPGGSLIKANVVTSKTEFCVAVSHFGQIAFHNQSGPADSCS